MKPLWWFLAIVGIVFSSVALAAAKSDEDEFIKQIARGITTSETAVACDLRTHDWRDSVSLGYIASARIFVMSVRPRASDKEITARAVNMFKAAKIEATMHAQFAAPTRSECDTLSASRDIENADAAAKIGLIFNTVNQ
jgi:hypothetical protein